MSIRQEAECSDSLFRDLIVFVSIIICLFAAYKTRVTLTSMDPESKRIEKYTTKEVSTFQMDLIQVEEFQQLNVSITQVAGTTLPLPGDLVKVNYKGMFSNGTRFDSSFEEESYIEFHAGFPGVIQGLSEGILKVPLHSRANIKIPYFLAYGDKSQGGLIPPKSNLQFEVHVRDIVKPVHQPILVKPDASKAKKIGNLLVWVLKEGNGQKISPLSYFYFSYDAFLENGLLINSTFIKREKEAFTKQNHLYELLKEAFLNRRLGDQILVKTSPIKGRDKVLFQNQNQSFYFKITL